MSDFLTLVQQLQRECGVEGAAISSVTTQTGLYNKLVNWIADADVHIQAMKIDWKFLWSEYSVDTGEGNAEPTVPADLNRWDRDSFYLDYGTAVNKHLRYMDYKTWRDGRGRGVQTNRKPSLVVIKPDNQIILSSPPDDTYVLTADYWKKPTRMAENTDTSNIPVNYERVILTQAKLWYAEEQEMPEVEKQARLDLFGDPRNKKDFGLYGRLQADQLPGQEGRTMGESPPITIVPE